MKKLYYETQGSNTYLVCEVGEKETMDTMSLGMLTNNKIPGLAPVIFTQMDNRKFVKFNVSAKISMSQFFEGSVNKNQLLGTFIGITNALISADDYMLNIALLLFDMEYIFVDVSTYETSMICLPFVDSEAKTTDIRLFFRDIMFKTQFAQNENCDHVAKIINYLNGTASFVPADFKNILYNLKGTAVRVMPPKPKKEERINPTPLQPRKVSQNVSKPQNFQNQNSVLPTPPSKINKEGMPAQENRRSMDSIQPSVLRQPKTVPQKPKISLFYLLQHYNQENAAAYKAQKASKKKGAGQPMARKNVQPVEQTPSASSNFGFAIPGQDFSMPTPASHHEIKPAFKQADPVQKQSPATVCPDCAQKKSIHGHSMNFGETTVLDNDAIGETTVLDNDAQQVRRITPYLLRSKNNEKIEINKPVFRIGKEKSYVDYFISDNTAVSRSHANIIIRGDKYFIVDTNSTNHTYINGKMIQSNVETEITHGDKIRLGNEDFEFRLF